MFQRLLHRVMYMDSSDSECEFEHVPMVVEGPRGRDLTNGMAYYHFEDAKGVRDLLTRGWKSLWEGTWPKIIRQEPIYINCTGINCSSHRFTPMGKWKVKGWQVFGYSCSSGKFKDILIREIPGTLTVKCFHIPNPNQNNTVLVPYR